MTVYFSVSKSVQVVACRIQAQDNLRLNGLKSYFSGNPLSSTKRDERIMVHLFTL